MAKGHAQLLQLCLTLYDRMDYSPPGSSVRGILQARVLEWVAISFSRGSSHPRDRTHISCLLNRQAGSLPLVQPAAAKSLQSCPTLWDPVGCSPPGSSVHGILQARVLEWVAMPSSQRILLTQGSSLSLLHCRQSLNSEPLWKLLNAGVAAFNS